MILVRLGICVTLLGLALYSYLQTQHALTHFKIQIPEMEKEITLVQEENRRLAHEISQFQNPSHLMELARRPEYSHLKHPVLKEVLTVPEAWASN